MKNYITRSIVLVCALLSFHSVIAYDFEVNGLRYNILSISDLKVQVASNGGGDGYSGEIIIPETVTYGGKTYTVTDIENGGTWGTYSGAFCQTSITALSIPKTIKKVPPYICMDCGGIKRLILAEGIESIENGAFYCTQIPELQLPQSLISIGSNAFGHNMWGYNEVLTKVVIPNNVISIGNECFNKSAALKTIVLGEKVASIGSSAFADCDKIEHIKCLNPVPARIESNTFMGKHWLNATLIVPVGCVTAYKNADYWKEFQNIVEAGSADDPTRPSAWIVNKKDGLSVSFPINDVESITLFVGPEDVVTDNDRLQLTEKVTIALTGTGTTVTGGGVYYNRTYTIVNNSSVNIHLTAIGSSNFQDLNEDLAAGASVSKTLYFNYNVTPQVTVRFTYNGNEYEVKTN